MKNACKNHPDVIAFTITMDTKEFLCYKCFLKHVEQRDKNAIRIYERYHKNKENENDEADTME